MRAPQAADDSGFCQKPRARSCLSRCARAGRRATQAAVFESFMWTTATRASPSVRSISAAPRSTPPPCAMSHPTANVCAVSIQTPRGNSGQASTIAFSSSNLEPIELPCPAVFSSRIRSSPNLNPRAACFSPCAIAAIAAPLSLPCALPGCSTRKSAPSAIARTISWWNACTERVRSTRIWRRKIDQIIAMDDERSESQFALRGRENVRLPPRRYANSRAPTFSGSTKISAARSRPARARCRAPLQCRLRWRCGFLCGGCRLSRREFRVRVAVPGGIRLRRRRLTCSCRFLPTFPQGFLEVSLHQTAWRHFIGKERGVQTACPRAIGGIFAPSRDFFSPARILWCYDFLACSDRRGRQVVRQRSAKPLSGVRFPPAPPESFSLHPAFNDC